MSDRLGPVSYKLSDDDPFLGREIHQQRQFSEHTMEVIDEEVAKILHAASQSASELLQTHRDKFETIARSLVAEEELDEKEIAALIGPPQPRQGEAQDSARSSTASRSSGWLNGRLASARWPGRGANCAGSPRRKRIDFEPIHGTKQEQEKTSHRVP